MMACHQLWLVETSEHIEPVNRNSDRILGFEHILNERILLGSTLSEGCGLTKSFKLAYSLANATLLFAVSLVLAPETHAGRLG